jgi:hypothetical protein
MLVLGPAGFSTGYADMYDATVYIPEKKNKYRISKTLIMLREKGE